MFLFFKKVLFLCFSTKYSFCAKNVSIKSFLKLFWSLLIYLFVCIQVYIWINIPLVFIHMCVCLCVNKRSLMYKYACVYVCVCVCVCVCVWTNKHSCINMCVWTNVHSCINMRVCMCVYVSICVSAYKLVKHSKNPDTPLYRMSLCNCPYSESWSPECHSMEYHSAGCHGAILFLSLI